jgi:hypothetical protein
MTQDERIDQCLEIIRLFEEMGDDKSIDSMHDEKRFTLTELDAMARLEISKFFGSPVILKFRFEAISNIIKLFRKGYIINLEEKSVKTPDGSEVICYFWERRKMKALLEVN